MNNHTVYTRQQLADMILAHGWVWPKITHTSLLESHTDHDVYLIEFIVEESGDPVTAWRKLAVSTTRESHEDLWVIAAGHGDLD